MFIGDVEVKKIIHFSNVVCIILDIAQYTRLSMKSCYKLLNVYRYISSPRSRECGRATERKPFSSTDNSCENDQSRDLSRQINL